MAPGFVAVDVLSPDVVASDAVLADGEAKLEIDVAGGIVIRLREDASADTLERVLGVVCRHGVARYCMDGGSHGEVRSC